MRSCHYQQELALTGAQIKESRSRTGKFRRAHWHHSMQSVSFILILGRLCPRHTTSLGEISRHEALLNKSQLLGAGDAPVTVPIARCVTPTETASLNTHEKSESYAKALLPH
jgi:hypothetical protein